MKLIILLLNVGAKMRGECTLTLFYYLLTVVTKIPASAVSQLVLICSIIIGTILYVAE